MSAADLTGYARFSGSDSSKAQPLYNAGLCYIPLLCHTENQHTTYVEKIEINVIHNIKKIKIIIKWGYLMVSSSGHAV